MWSQERDGCGVCAACRSLVDLKASSRCSRAIYPKPADTSYYDLTKQNEFLVKSVFDGKGNCVYHRDCIRGAYGVSNQRLSRLRKGIRTKTSDPTYQAS